MNSVDFCFWLQGHFELGAEDGKGLSPAQTETIKNHLHLVFKHEIDPLREQQTTATASQLNKAHKPGSGNDSLVRC